MPPDQNLTPSGQLPVVHPPGEYSGGVVSGGPGLAPAPQYQYETGGPVTRTRVGAVLLLVLSLFNLMFLLVAAAASTGLLENEDSAVNGASFFAMAVMTFIAGSLGLLFSYIGMQLSRTIGSAGLAIAHRTTLGLVLVLTALAMLGPIFS